MTSSSPSDVTKAGHAPKGPSRAIVLPNRFEEPLARQQRLQRTGDSDPWANAPQPPPALRYAHTYPSTAIASAQSIQSLPQRTPVSPSFSPETTGRRWPPDQWTSPPAARNQEAFLSSPWPADATGPQYPMRSPISSHHYAHRYSYTGWDPSWPAPLLRRTSSDDTRLHKATSDYYGGEASSSTSSLHGKAYPQRRPSNRDEFDGPSQLLEKLDDRVYEPKEEDLPALPITLYAQEQDDILSKVNDRLSQCAFDFVARYQFPVPIEPDKRPVRVPGDREWSEWVYLLKRLATKRRIPARVLYNGQIKQLITILENSLEMRHAAKHQSRPLKDDRNILQLVSSGLQVAKIVKDAEAMRYLDGLYVHTERIIQSRKIPVAVAVYSSGRP